MQRWEYLFIENVKAPLRGPITQQKWKPWKINDQILDDWENGPTLSEYYNWLGQQGWEMVSGECSQSTFKRPI